MIHRLLNLPQNSSFLLFGARGTGKSTLLKQHFKEIDHLFIDLLDPLEEDRLARKPRDLVQRIAALPESTEWILIDEVQRLPKLLDLIHQLIENTEKKFALTGSSSRKLKRGAANLLAGRAFVQFLHPFCSFELGDSFDLNQALRWGTLPRLLHLTDDKDRESYLRSYSLTYLREEIVAEQVIRKLDPFRLFLDVAAQSNGTIVNFSNIARDTGVDTKTVQSYFEILEDTLIAFLLVPFDRSVRKRQRQNPKFYYFDTGVQRALARVLRIPLKSGTFAFGNAFEHFLIAEIRRLTEIFQPDWRLSYLCTKDNAEIDLILDRPGLPLALLEFKSTDRIEEKDCTTLTRFLPNLQPCEAWVLSRDPTSRKINGITCMHWTNWLKEQFPH